LESVAVSAKERDEEARLGFNGVRAKAEAAPEDGKVKNDVRQGCEVADSKEAAEEVVGGVLEGGYKWWLPGGGVRGSGEIRGEEDVRPKEVADGRESAAFEELEGGLLVVNAGEEAAGVLYEAVQSLVKEGAPEGGCADRLAEEADAAVADGGWSPERGSGMVQLRLLSRREEVVLTWVGEGQDDGLGFV
jgi:hypothetical protein